MSFNLTLSYLRDAVQEDLGDVAELVGSGFIDRSINEGQRRAEPTLLKDAVAAAPMDSGDTTYTVPTDLVEITSFIPDDNFQPPLPIYRQHGLVLYFECALTADWSGNILYRAHYPNITETVDCQLPQAGADALISFGLYKSFRRLASNRSEYRKFATIVGNGVTMADLEATAEAHLQDFADAIESAAILPRPATYYGE